MRRLPSFLVEELTPRCWPSLHTGMQRHSYRHHNTVNDFPVIRHISLDEPIDLLNVAFENPRKIRVQLDGNIGALPKKKRKQMMGSSDDRELSSYMVPDRVTGLQEVEELGKLCPGRVWNFVSLTTESRTSPVLRAFQG